MNKTFTKIMLLTMMFMAGANSVFAIETYDFQDLCMALGTIKTPVAVNDDGDAGFTLGEEGSEAIMHFLGDYEVKGQTFTWNKRFAYEFVEGRNKFCIRNKNNKRDKNCGLFSWDYNHYFSVLDLKDGDKVTFTILAGSATFASENVVEGEPEGTVDSNKSYTITTEDGSTHLDIIMTPTTLISKIVIEPYGVETVPTIVLSANTLKLIPGATATLKANVTPNSFSTEWKSSDESVATVDASGTVTAVGPGTATITSYWNSEISEATSSDDCEVTVADVDLSTYIVTKEIDFTAMETLLPTLESVAAASIWNYANAKANPVYFCTDEGLTDIALQAVAERNGKGWSIINDDEAGIYGLYLGTGAGRCAAVGGLTAGQIVEVFYTGSGFYHNPEGDKSAATTALNEGEGRAIFQMDANGMFGFELNKGNAVTKIVVYTPQTVSIQLDKAYTTFSSSVPVDFTGTNIIAYTAVIDAAAKTVAMTPIVKVPAATGVLLKGQAGATADLKVIAEADADAIEQNDFVAVLNPIEAPATAYILATPEEGVQAFYRANGNKIAAGKAYIDGSEIALPEVGSVAEETSEGRLTIVFTEATGIVSVVNGQSTVVNAVYDLQGRQYPMGDRQSSMAKGIYIKNGRKIVR